VLKGKRKVPLEYVKDVKHEVGNLISKTFSKGENFMYAYYERRGEDARGGKGTGMYFPLKKKIIARVVYSHEGRGKGSNPRSKGKKELSPNKMIRRPGKHRVVRLVLGEDAVVGKGGRSPSSSILRRKEKPAEGGRKEQVMS